LTLREQRNPELMRRPLELRGWRWRLMEVRTASNEDTTQSATIISGGARIGAE